MIVFSTYITEGLLSCTYAFPDCRNSSFWKASLLFTSKHVYSLKVAKRFGKYAQIHGKMFYELFHGGHRGRLCLLLLAIRFLYRCSFHDFLVLCFNFSLPLFRKDYKADDVGYECYHP